MGGAVVCLGWGKRKGMGTGTGWGGRARRVMGWKGEVES